MNKVSSTLIPVRAMQKSGEWYMIPNEKMEEWNNHSLANSDISGPYAMGPGK
jgi:hypothetical protein